MAECEELKFFTFNANGLGEFKKRKDVFDFLRKQRGNVFLLQETHWKSNLENIIRSQWGFECFVSGQDSGSKGVAILFMNNFEYKVHRVIKDNEGRYILIDIEMFEKRMTLGNVYAPSAGDHHEFFEKLFREIISMDNELIVIGGDWNVALNPKLDTNHPSNVYRARSRKIIVDFMNDYDLVDIFRTLHGDTRKYTWRRFNSTQRSRLDYFLVSEQFGLDILSCANIVPGYYSDHSLVYIGFKTGITKRSRPYWKFNNSLLRDKAFVDQVKQIILDVKKQYAVPLYDMDNLHQINDEELCLTIDDQLFFEMLLLSIRGKCISYASHKKKEDNRMEKEILSEIKYLEENVTEDNIQILEQKRQELLELRKKKVDGMIIRSRAKWIYEGEKTSKYFCNLERRNFIQKAMCFIQKDNGEIIHDSKSITQEAKLFYEKLYTSQEKDILNIDIGSIIKAPVLTKEESDSLEGNITFQEALAALKQMKNDKSPGSDGYTVEFFKFFFKDLGTFMIRSFNYGFDTGELSVTQRQGVITCIPKEGKDKQFLKNWRPITLLNTAYKIASACIGARLKTVLPKLIGEDQKGFLKGRYIGENIRLVYDTLLYASKHKIPGLLLLVDFEKAFDSVAWSFINKSLSVFNFGHDIKRWVSTFYANIKSCIYVNGNYSEWFDVKRGTRQGDPLSPYLFLICAEILSLMIRQNININGMKVLDEEILLSQFADDTTFFLDGRRESFCACIRTLQQFALMSGLKMNYEKTMVVWIGSQRNSHVKYMPELNLSWNPVTFKILGVVFSINVHEIVLINYENKLGDIRKLLNCWSRRNLTPYGKITVIKTLALSKITHLFLNLPDPDEAFMKDLEKLLYSFLWDDKNDKIKRSSMCQSYEDGGLKMVNIKTYLSALKITWIKRILLNKGKLTNILLAMCPLIQNIKQHGCEFVNVIMQRIENPFWVDVLKHFMNLYRKCVPESVEDFVCECIHYNNNICREKKVVFHRNWIRSGIISIGQLIGRNGYLTYDEFVHKFPNAKADFLLYEGIISAIKSYQRKVNIVIDENCNTSQRYEASVWKFLSKSDAKHIYSFLNKNSETPKCIEKWSRLLDIEIDVNNVFLKIQKTTFDTSLKWLQYRLLYRLLPTGRFLFLRKLTDSPICRLCRKADETLLHMFWECEQIQDFWRDLENWLHEKFVHCTDITFSKELIILGSKQNVITDRIFDLIILMAKFHIFVSKLRDVNPHLNCLIRNIKNMYIIEKYRRAISDMHTVKNDWLLYNLQL